MPKTKIKKWGNSLALRIPKYLADELSLKEDDEVELIADGGELIIRPRSNSGSAQSASEREVTEKVTPYGKGSDTPGKYVVDAKQFEQMRKKLELLEGLARGEKAILEDRVVTHEEAKKRMSRWLK